ncbi:hypothetical protein ASF23_03620 [Curtobacterium sp. Leaf261]|nr:hypothetical protein ASF23_03620 [Curtobacterium sp. Leaf261]
MTKWIELHEQPDARKQYRAATGYNGTLRDPFTFVQTYRPFPTAVKAHPRARNLTYLEPVYEIWDAHVAAALATLEADELETARELDVPVNALQDQHWHATSNAKERAEKRRTLAALRVGLLTGPALHLAVRRWGTTAWEDLAMFREPDAAQSTRRPRNLTGSTVHSRVLGPSVETGNLVLDWPRNPSTARNDKTPASARR